MRLFGASIVTTSIATAQGTTGSWSLGPPLPTKRSEVSVATVGSEIVLLGGSAPAGSSPTQLDSSGKVDVDQRRVQVFDIATQRWSDRAQLPRGMNHVGVTSYRDRIYTFGGFIGRNRNPVTDAYTYDPQTDRWTAIAPLPRPLGSISVAVLGDKIHLIGGRDVHSVTDHEVYDPAANSYSSAAPLQSVAITWGWLLTMGSCTRSPGASTTSITTPRTLISTIRRTRRRNIHK